MPLQYSISSIDMVREYRLKDLIRNYQSFSEDEVRFIKNNSRINFLLYNKIDKTPVLAIEVDGISFHYFGYQPMVTMKKRR